MITPSSELKKKSSQPEFDYVLKIIIIGDSGVGKSSMLVRYNDGKYMENYMMTIGITYVKKIVEIDGVTIKLQIWDTAGQEKYKTITQNYYRNSHGAIISFSIDSRDSFSSVRSWIDELNQIVKDSTQILLVGTKADLVDQREVSTEQAEEFANNYKIPYLECSAKNGQSVNQVFQKITRMMKAKLIDEVEEESPPIPDPQFKLVTYGKHLHSKCCQN